MKKIILSILLNCAIFVLYSQESCDVGYFIVSEDGYSKLEVTKVERALKTLDKDCIENNAEYGEVVNEYLFMCLTYCCDTLFKVMVDNKCKPFYNIVLNELANPVSDAYDFQSIYCNMSSLKKKKEGNVKEEMLSKFKEGIASIILDYKTILETDCTN